VARRVSVWAIEFTNKLFCMFLCALCGEGF